MDTPTSHPLGPRLESVRAELVHPLRWRVLRPNHPPSRAVWPGDDDPTTRHWAAWLGGEVVAVLSIFRTPSPRATLPRDIDHQLRGMAVAPEVRRQGLGRALLSHATTQLDQPLWCNARIRARVFYERCGWRAHGTTFVVPDVGPHVLMEHGLPREPMRDPG